jgi:F-type H+-transporting ATPase subunit c
MAMIGLLAQVVDKAPFAFGAGLAGLGGGVGAGLVVLGAGLGIGRLAGQAMDGIARQPEVAGRIFTNMIIAAALIEGIAFFALVVCLGLIGKIMPV